MGERYRNSVGECHYLKESETVFVNAWHSLAWFWQQLWFSSVILFLVPWLSVHGRSPTSPIKHETQEPNRASHSIFMANMIFFSVGHVQSVCQSNLSASQNFGGDTGKRMKVEATFFFFFSAWLELGSMQTGEMVLAMWWSQTAIIWRGN